jgi:uncharacterized RDD family membrane protein YckC
MTEEENGIPDFIEERDLFGNVIPKRKIPLEPKDGHAKLPELDVEYAGLGIRIVAYILDIAILLFPIFFIDKVAFGFDNPGTDYVAKSSFLNFLIWGFYYAITESSDKQATFGKRICKLKVINAKGEALSFRQAYWHFTLQIVSILPLGFGIWAIATDKKKQGWHDMIIGSYVIISKSKTTQTINENV